MGEGLLIFAIALGGMIVALAGWTAFLGWLGRRETKRSEEHMAELAHMTALAVEGNRTESRRFWERHEKFWGRHEKFWERADKRWADHESLMRMIYERGDTDKSSG